MNTLANKRPVTASARLLFSLFLSVMAFATLAEAWAAQAGGAKRVLVDVKGGKGLKIDTERVKYRGSAPLWAAVSAKEGEVRVPTANPRVIAFVGYDQKGACRLRIHDAKGNRLSEIHCESDLIRIPEDRDLIWIAGRTQREGYQSLGKPFPYSGLSLYDFAGRKLRAVDKDVIGVVGLMYDLPDGAVILLHSAKDFKGIAKVDSDGSFEWKVPISEPITDMRVFGDGDFIATQALFFSQGRRKAALYGPERKVLVEIEGTHEEYPEVLGVSPDKRHFVVATNSGRRRHLKILAVAAPSKPVKEVEVGHAIRQLEIDNNLRVLGTQFSEIKEFDVHVEGFRIFDLKGNVLAEQECPYTQRGRVRLGKDQRSVSWSCGAERVDLEMNEEQR